MKVKIFYTDEDLESLEEKINEFIKDKKVIDMKFSVHSYFLKDYSSHFPRTDTNVLIMYEEIGIEIA